MKVQGWSEVFKVFFFFEHDNNKKQTSSALDFPIPLITIFRRCLNPIFQNQHPCIMLHPLYWKISQTSGQGQQHDKDHIVNYHPNPS